MYRGDCMKIKKVHGESPQWIVPAGLFVVQ